MPQRRAQTPSPGHAVGGAGGRRSQLSGVRESQTRHRVPDLRVDDRVIGRSALESAASRRVGTEGGHSTLGTLSAGQCSTGGTADILEVQYRGREHRVPALLGPDVGLETGDRGDCDGRRRSERIVEPDGKAGIGIFETSHCKRRGRVANIASYIATHSHRNESGVWSRSWSVGVGAQIVHNSCCLDSLNVCGSISSAVLITATAVQQTLIGSAVTTVIAIRTVGAVGAAGVQWSMSAHVGKWSRYIAAISCAANSIVAQFVVRDKATGSSVGWLTGSSAQLACIVPKVLVLTGCGTSSFGSSNVARLSCTKASVAS